MPEQPVIVQKISWSDLFPWAIIFKTLSVATSVTVLSLALLGVVLTPMGWFLSETVIRPQAQDDPNLAEVVASNRSPYRGVFLSTERQEGALNIMGLSLSGPRVVFHQIVKPFRYLFDGQLGMREFWYFLFGGIWSIAVWSFVGLAIARVCLLRLTRNEQIGLDDAFEFAVSKWQTVFGAILIPLVAVAALCIPAFLLGLLMGFDFGLLMAGVAWGAILLLALAMGVLLMGLMFGWPLMVSSVGCESQNAFDAMTRAYAYTFQRPLHYAFYIAVSILFGGFCWVIVASLTNGVVELSFWATSWGANMMSTDRVELIQGLAALPDGVEESQSMWAGRNLIGLWNALLKTIAAGFVYGLFWCMSAAVYLLLRKDVDETEMDEIFLSDEKRDYDLPPLKSDARGIPQVQTPVPVPSDPVAEVDDAESNGSD